MKIFADLHLHSRYSRATSKNLSLQNLEKYAKIKGLSLLGTGDFTHPKWLAELKENLAEDGTGILRTKTGFPFVLQAEISNMFSQDGKPRKVHTVLLAKNFEIVRQINEKLSKKGNLSADGRPVFGKYSCIELVEDLKSIDNSIEIIPAHCMLPGTLVCSNHFLKNVEEIKEDDEILTHKGRYKKISKIFRRWYSGKIIKITPWYWTEGVKVTEEHPLLAIKPSICRTRGGCCKPTPRHKKKCKANITYVPFWIQANKLKKGDVILYPRFRSIKSKVKGIVIGSEKIKLDEDVCRFFGYYLAEGYSNGRDGIGLSFSPNELSYISEVRSIMKKKFGINVKKGKNEGDLAVYSKSLMKFIENEFYSRNAENEKRAWTKKIPEWMLGLDMGLQAEILRGWWRGDRGYTTSRLLANQMKIICLRLGILPSILIDSQKAHKKRGKHFINGREIKAKHDIFVFSLLSFFEDNFNLLLDPAFKRRSVKENSSKHGWIDSEYVYLTIKSVETFHHKGEVYNFEVDDDNSYLTEFATVHNCWTPWFSVFGSMSGFDSLKECFREKTRHIHAIETGLSSDPPMNWRMSWLDGITLVSNSDSHSFWPWRMGRECNILDIDLNYNSIINSIRTKKGFVGTIEVDPNYGKYHYDGHRNCCVSLHPKETRKLDSKCPKCSNRMTIGVLNRVEELADREEGFVPENAPKFYSLLPLHELIKIVHNTSESSKKSWALYWKLVKEFGPELDILMNAEKTAIAKVDERLAEAIMQNREGSIKVIPGFDGEYGRPVLDVLDG